MKRPNDDTADQVCTSSSPTKKVRRSSLSQLDDNTDYTPGYPTDVLYQATPVTTKVVQEDGSSEQFIIPKTLLCAKSEFFQTALQSEWLEGQSNELTIHDTEHWVFKCFYRWLHTDLLTMLPGENVLSNAELHDPTSWSYLTLFKLYVFADQYSSRRFRNIVFEAIQHKSQPPGYVHKPPIESLAYLMLNLLPCSPLRRYVIDLYIREQLLRERNRVSIDPTPRIFVLPDNMSCELVLELGDARWQRVQALHCREFGLCHLTQIHGPCKSLTHVADHRLYVEEKPWCFYHEHASQQEREACMVRKHAYDEKHAKASGK